jgi:hypothetical protein
MELAIMIVLTLSLGALLFSRIHFHFSFNLTISRDSKFNSRLKTPPSGSGKTRRENAALPKVEAPAVRSIRDSSVTSAIEAARRSAEADLSSALINLGCRKEKAESVAKRAMVEGGKDFDSRLKWALTNAA